MHSSLSRQAPVAEPGGDAARSAFPASVVVAQRELQDLWLGGRGLPLMLAFTLMSSVTSYLISSNQTLNFLEVRESVSLSVRVAVAVSALLVVLAAADAISGERERGTLESLLLTPAPRRSLVVGKGVAALSLWLAAVILSMPYVWFLGRGVGVVGKAAVGSLVVSGLLALFLTGLGLVISIVLTSNRVSLALSLFMLVALYAPSQLATVGLQPSAGDLVQRLDPFTSGLRYLDALVVGGHSYGQDVGLLLAPGIGAVAFPVAALAMSGHLALFGRDRP